MEGKLIAVASFFLLVLVVSAQDDGKNPNANYTLSFMTWTSKEKKAVRLPGHGGHHGHHHRHRHEDDEVQGHHHHVPYIQGKFAVSAQTKDGKSTVVGQSRGLHYVSNRLNILRVLLPKNLKNVTSLSLKFEQGVNSTKGAALNVRYLDARTFWPPRLAFFTLGLKESTVLESGKTKVFKRLGLSPNEIEDQDLFEELKNAGVLGENDQHEEDEHEEEDEW